MIIGLRARPGLTTVLALTLALLFLMADCGRDDTGSGSYNPSGGDTTWWPKREALQVPAAAPGTQRILLLGDSITWGGNLQGPRLDARLADRLRVDPSRVVNHGVNGQNLAGLNATFNAEVSALAPGDVVFIADGMNDLPNYPGDPYFTSTYFNMVIHAVNLGLNVVVCEITPEGSRFWPQELTRQHVNDWFTGEFGGLVLHYDTVLANPTNVWLQNRYNLDDIHPNEGGTARMADLGAAYLQAQSWWSG